MQIVYIFIFVLKIRVLDCHLKDLGEVTNFSTIIDTWIPRAIATKLKNNKNTLMVGGTPAYASELPHNVLFLNFEGLCDGVIISETIVLTAAHCLDTNTNLLEMRIYAGCRYLFDETADIHTVWDFKIHERYNNPFPFSNDAALLIIHDKFRFKGTVKRAMLVNHRDWMKEGTVIKVSGWGETWHGSDKSKSGLQSLELKFVPLGECRAVREDSLESSQLSPDMFCLSGEPDQGLCRGDSGSGALWNNMIVGIVSHGGACREYPGVLTNVYYLRPWIEMASKKLYYKYCRFHTQEHGDY